MKKSNETSYPNTPPYLVHLREDVFQGIGYCFRKKSQYYF
ncbi:22381_t:CDS:2 [Entrophospora sp. SA101]|nr:22381_t:CDS:2 [Entrophospora sp. SA101]